MSHIIVIGAGQAGSSLTAKLRNSGFDGDITLIGSETVPPYQRPPLSKAYLLGEMEKERLFLRPEQFYADQNITLRLGAPVTAIDRAAKTVSVAGETLEYDQLVLTTGSNPRHLPASIGGALHGVHVVRSLDDVDAMGAEMAPGKRALIVGGGYIGLEAAAVASKMGLTVTVIEMADRILQRVAAPETSGYFRKLHEAHGVDIRESVGLDRLLGESHVSGAKLTDGSHIDVDMVIVGVGITPGDALAADAGLTINNGVETDAHGRTSDPDIWAAGDCASFPWQGGRIRLESVQNAIDQAELVAENIMGAGKDYMPMPWFWSDQYDVKLQIAGLNTGYDKIAVRHIDDAVSYWYYKGDKLLAVDAMNDPRSYMIGKRLIEAGKSPSADLVSDPDTDMKALLK
ncbi:3-phenylpropionate/trans-cinnamate dioxygenase ferredoxin reductase subunit [Litoreibacter ascidiaceicola]|uniref:3-phenylpropionate/trans-cinnamate dioxygenase ferredoxin reductase subunit n=1 Tax=Litoreibacter ascidiaceicola TaxID=1486859 RepID=A0A1M5B027_9RHOB|nr:FAD-dependent oxidoreductase [Litoreibacter ascidiaceicola]SHF35809.1 3-phenylpropionate/trans-cinnamate dioxygenase ferredoxin reductase subunit [Litoreibacter ascidiaceicola]